MSVSDGRKSSSRESELDSEEEWQPEIVDDDERPFIPMSFGTEALTNWLTHAPIKRARYGDFSSIDWINDNIQNRRHRRRLSAGLKTAKGRLYFIYDSIQPWIVLLGVGVTMGIIATCIATTTQWLTDIKVGYCSTGFYLNRRFCCLEAGDFCEGWREWKDFLHIKWAWLAWVVQFFTFLYNGVLFAGLSTYLVTKYAPYAAGQGIAEIKTIMGGFVMRQFLGGTTLLIKCVGTVFSVSSGLCVGKEAPLVHIACCCGNVLSRLFRGLRKSEAKRRQVLSAASAAGISVAFGAPIGGVLFSLEEISYYFPAETMWKSFFCASVAAITLKFFDPFRNGKLVPFQVVYDRTWHPFELVFFILIGIIGGLVGTFLTSAIIRLGKYRQNSFLKNLGRAEVIAVTTATIIISYTNPFLRDDLVTLVSNLFNECKNSDIDGVCDVERYHGNVISLLLASFVRIFLAIMACGLAVPAGIFMPSMGIGAGIGRAIGMIVQHWHITNPQAAIFSSCPADVVCVTPGVYALVGAAALLASTTRMTATVVVVMFELTGALIYVLPIMVAVMVSKWTRDSLTNESIFEGVIRLNGYPYLSMHNDEHIPGSVNEIMTIAEDLLIIHGNGCTFGKLREILGSCDYQGLPVVESPLSMKLLGYISTPDLRLAIEQALDSGEFDNDTICYFGGHVPIDEDDSIRATKSWLDMRPWMDQTPIVVNTTEPLNLVAERFKHLGIRYVLITYQGALSGLVTKKDMIREPTRNHRQLPNDSISLRTLFFRNVRSCFS